MIAMGALAFVLALMCAWIQVNREGQSGEQLFDLLGNGLCMVAAVFAMLGVMGWLVPDALRALADALYWIVEYAIANPVVAR